MRRVGLVLLLVVVTTGGCKKTGKQGTPAGSPGTAGVGLSDAGAGATARGLDAGPAPAVDAAASAPVIDAGPTIDATPPGPKMFPLALTRGHRYKWSDQLV